MAPISARSALLAVLSPVGSLASPSWPLPLRSEGGEPLEARSLQEAAGAFGATLDAVHVLRLEDNALVHVRHPVGRMAAELPGRRLANATGGKPHHGLTRRDVVRMLMHTNVVAYGSSDPYNEAVMSAIIAAKDSLYGPKVDTYEKEVEEEKRHFQRREAFFSGKYTVETGGTGIDASGSDSIGVHALEFTLPSIGKVLTFRGSKSTGDFDNIKLWITDWIVAKMTAKMKYAWLSVAGLPWSADLQREKKHLDFFSDQVLYVGSWWFGSDFLHEIRALAEGTGGLVDPDEAVKTGYWEFTKLIANSVRDHLGSDGKLTITGHSQGGGRAALVAMYYEKTFGEKYDTVTFAATGGQCFSRQMSFTDASLTDDLDPYVFHSQVTEYVHPLDVYGMFDYDVGTRCVYGTTGVERSNARKYCELIFGYQGADLMVAGHVGHIGEDMANEFSRCRYFTHAWMAMDRALMNDDFIHTDGTTDGGCEPVDPVPKDDPSKLCPSATWVDGCNDELSCEACQVSTSVTGAFSCYWCDSESRCRSGSDSFVQCKGGYTGPRGVCQTSSPKAVVGSRQVLLTGMAVMATLALVLVAAGCFKGSHTNSDGPRLLSTVDAEASPGALAD